MYSVIFIHGPTSITTSELISKLIESLCVSEITLEELTKLLVALPKGCSLEITTK